MNLLAFDTSTEFLSLALQMNGRLTVHFENAGQASSQRILPQISELLAEAQVPLRELDGIAYGAGPGAFTGVRVACGVAQGLAFGAQLPVVGVNTLHAIAEVGAETSGVDKAIVCIDARMGEVYFAALEKRDGVWVEVLPTQVCKPQAAPLLDAAEYVGVGTGWATYDEVLSARFNVRAKLPEITPKAEAILKLALPTFAAGQALTAAEARPVYVRNRVALTSEERARGAQL
jgi:tRNA threonylcarbamoyladenosine biosynthesis protein TsaB